MNLRILIYLNPSNVNNITHKLRLQGDSGFNLIKNSIVALNRLVDWHFYILVPTLDCWEDKPNNVTLYKYPYMNDALNNRFNFNSGAIISHLNSYRHDIDVIWTMQPEHADSLKAIAVKRREEIPVFSYISWLDHSNGAGYGPFYKLRLLNGIYNSNATGIQSQHMLKTFKKIYSKYDVDYSKFKIISPKTSLPFNVKTSLGDFIAFPHRVSQDSKFTTMFDLIKNNLKYDIWVSNLGNKLIPNHPQILNKYFDTQKEYLEQIAQARFGVSYHINYSMWSMSVLDMMGLGKVILCPDSNAFPEMFDKDYPFLFNSEDEFVEKFNFLQTCDANVLSYWGNKNKNRIKSKFTWGIQAKEIKKLFYSLVGNKTTGDLINKNLTTFSRRCSRAWNKCRIELMRDFNVYDDITKEHTTFYINRNDYKINGEITGLKKIPTPYDIKLKTQKLQETLYKNQLALD